MLASGVALDTDGTATAGTALTDTANMFDYDAGDMSYPNVRVGNSARAVTVRESVAHPGAVAVITPSDQDTEIPGHQVILGAGTKTDIMVVVTAEDGTTTETYSITVYRERRVESDNENLSALVLSGVTLSSPFASSKTSYIGRAEYSTDETTVSYTADIGAMVDIRNDDNDADLPDADGNTDGHQVALGVGVETVINVVVTAEDQVGEGSPGQKEYKITVYRENLVRSDDATLALDTATPPGLVLASGVALDTDGTATAGTALTDAANMFDYDAGDMSYPNVRVGNGVDAVTVRATTADIGAMTDITPSDQDSLIPGHQVILGAGTKTDIMVVVTAEDGTTTETYSITVYRERRVESDNENLSALVLSGVTLSSPFASSKTSYIGRAEYSTDETTVSYTADIGAMVDIRNDDNDADLPDADGNTDGHQVALDEGVETVINVVVTAEDQVGEGSPGQKEYKITVYRENLQPSDDATLALDTATPPGLVLASGVALDTDGTATAGTALTDAANMFDYDAGDMSYPNVRVGNSVRTLTVTPATAHLGAMTDITPSDQDSLIPGHQVILGAGTKTDIMVVVTAEDGTTTETYSITVYRERRVLSDNAELSALALSGVTLSPEFASNRVEYTGAAAYSTEKTTVSYTADVGARMVLIGNNADPIAGIPDADTPAPGHQVRLAKGQATVINVVVTAEGPAAGESDANTKTYKITVYRDNAPSSEATLQSLTLSGITLSPAFNSATTMYTAEVDALEMTMVEAMATHPGAMVEGTGEMALVVGENMISVTVTAEDETTQTYTVTVTVAMGDTLFDTYDVNNNNQIDKDEALTAIEDYLIHETISKEQALDIIAQYILR